MRKVLIIGGILFTILVFGNAANACSCYARDTVDKELAKTPNVVVLKLRSISQNEGEPANYSLSVERLFKGELKTGEILIFPIGSNCDWFFTEKEIGEEFLFFLNKRPSEGETWRASRCSRSGRVKDRTADLRYLENEKNLRGKTRLSGTLIKRIEAIDPVDSSYPPLAGWKLRIIGAGKKIELVTDDNGVYEIYDLPPGKYKVFPQKVEGYTFSSENRDYDAVEIKPNSQAENDFWFYINNGVSGKVVDREGKPLKDVRVELISTSAPTALRAFTETETDEKGEFEISSIPVGTYHLVVNKEDRFSLGSKRSFDTFYYPNVSTAAEAAEITIGENYFLTNLVLVPPRMPEMITLTGRVIFADGTPAANQTVQFLNGDKILEVSKGSVVSEFEVETDKNGRFSIRTIKGQPGILRAVTYSFLGESKNCPEIDEILKRSGDTIKQLETSHREIAADGNLSGIELKFPFRRCKEIE